MALALGHPVIHVQLSLSKNTSLFGFRACFFHADAFSLDTCSVLVKVAGTVIAYTDACFLQGLLPVKWMALEALFDHVYTTQSDV